MSLKKRVRAALNGAKVDPDVGFDLPRPRLLHYQEPNNFVKAVKDQADNLAMVDAGLLHAVDIDGKVGKTDYRLSFAAFSDMCHFSKTPVRFIKTLARHAEHLALEVVEEVLRYQFHSGQDKLLVVDTRTGRVEGIVGKESYSPINHMDVIDYTLTANTALEFTNGWLSGPTMRMTSAVKDKPVEVKKDDVMLIGTNVENALHGDRSVRVSDYLERLVCTNGMVARDSLGMARIVHQGDVEYKVQEAVLKCADRAQQLVPTMRAATRYILNEEEIRSIRTFIIDPNNGGSPRIDRKAVNGAMDEAEKEGRKEEEVSLWNMVNGITASAHDADSLQQKNDIEALGYKTLVKYGATLLVN